MQTDITPPDVNAVREAILGGTTDIASLAGALGCSVRKVERLIEAGLPVIRIGRDRRFNLDNCRAWVMSHESTARQEPRRGRPRKAA